MWVGDIVIMRLPTVNVVRWFEDVRQTRRGVYIA